MKRILTLLVCALALPSCAQRLDLPASTSGPARGCRLPVVKLAANQYDDPEEGTALKLAGVPVQASDRLGTLGDSIRSGDKGQSPYPSNSVLVLSGGSLHGAFGAGLFYGWMKSQANGDKIPAYRIVTGVSTGALQSTFIFLDSSPDPAVRALAGDAEEIGRLRKVKFLAGRMGRATDGVDAPGTSYLGNLAQDYMPDREADLLHLYSLQKRSPNKLGMLALATNLSVATMQPLRDVIGAEMGPQTIRGVSMEADRGRKLFVAIADLVNGYGYAADLTKLAQVAADPEKHQTDAERVFPNWHPGDRRNLIDAARQCYIDALVASSSVPPGVPPVSIEIIKEDGNGDILNPDPPRPGQPPQFIPSNRVAGRHIFIDGGAAFAVFFSQLNNQLPEFNNADMDLIVNGTYYPQEWNKFQGDNRPTREIGGVRVSSFDVMLQSAELLQTQVRLFSVQEARRWAQGKGTFRWAFIDNRRITPGPGEIDDFDRWDGRFGKAIKDWSYSGQTCEAWHNADARLRPMEFYPQYMRCMVDYGMRRGEDPVHRWNLCISKDPAKCPRDLPH